MTERQQTIDIPPPKADDGGLLGLLTGTLYFHIFSNNLNLASKTLIMIFKINFLGALDDMKTKGRFSDSEDSDEESADDSDWSDSEDE